MYCLLAGAWQCLIKSGGLLVDGIDGVERFLWILKAVLEPCLMVLRRRNFSNLQSCDFCEHCTNRPETGRFSSSLLQDWLAPSRLVLAPDPLRLSGAFAAAKAAAQLATAKVGVHLYSL